MRVMKVISSLGFGGAETQVINLSKSLANQGHQVLLVSLNSHVPRATELVGSQVILKVEDKRQKIDLSVIKNLRRYIKDWKPDIVHAYLYDAEFYVRLAGLGLNAPIINSERNDNYKLNWNQKAGDFCTIGLVDGVIANSNAGKSFAAARYRRLPASGIHALWNGIDLNRIKVKKSNCMENYKVSLFGEKPVKLACMVAAIKPQKDYTLALQVAEKLVQSNDEWRVVFLGDKLAEGDYGYKSGIERHFDGLKNKEKIKFLGNRNDVVEILSQADVSFLTSHYEGFPNAVLESMAVGTPVITTDFSDIKQIAIRDWMIIGNRDTSIFVDAINKASLERKTLSAESMAWVEENCSMDAVVKKLLSIYEKYVVNAKS